MRKKRYNTHIRTHAGSTGFKNIMIKVLNFSGSSRGRVSFSICRFVSAPVRTIATSQPQAKRPAFDVKTWKSWRVREIRLNTLQKLMNPDEIAEALAPLRLQVKEQGELVICHRTYLQFTIYNLHMQSV